MTSLSVRKAEGLIFIIAIIIGLAGLFVLIPTNPVTFNANIELEPGSFLFRGYLENDNDFRIHSLRVLESSTRMHVVLICGANDFDVYGSHGYTPTQFNYEFRGYEIGGEDLVYDYPEEGIWNIMIHSFSGSGEYELRVEIEY